MNAIVDALSGPTWQHLALALLHTLWQGLAAAALLWLLLRRIGGDRPNARYWAAFSILAGLLLCGLTTWAVLDYQRLKAPGAVSDRAAVSTSSTAPTADTLASPSTADRSSRFGQSDTDVAPARPNWSVVLLAAWFLGVALMAARMAWMVGRSQRLMHGPEINDGGMLAIVERLCRSFGMKRRLRIVEAAEGFGPAVVGVIQPVLAIPLSMLTGLPPEALRAVLAHELAHIRRHDYLLNLVQMAIEAVLFFNPAVWWISRQIRIEREACCDAMAAKMLERPLALAEALSLWAERVHAGSALAVAFAGDGRRGPRLLLDRIRRLLQPGYRPQLPLSPMGLLGFFMATAIALGGLSCGMKAVVDLAAKALTPAERMKQVTQTQRQYAAPEEAAETGSPDGAATLSGTIRTRDGSPPPKKTRVNRRTERRKCITFANGGEQPPDFSVDAGTGTTWLIFEAEGYAPALVGPFRAKAGETISGIKVFLDRGFGAAAHVVDENGKPIEGAEVRGSLMTGENTIGSGFRRLSDSKGIAAMTHLAEGNYRFDIHKAGLQPLEGFVQPVAPRQPITFTLAHAKPLRGVVVSANGQPVAGVEIRQYAKFTVIGNASSSNMSGQNGPIVAVTNAQGRFVLDQLLDGATYALLVSTKNQQHHLVRDVAAGQNDLRIQLGPDLTISGVIRGDLARLTEKGGTPSVRWSQSITFPAHSCSNGDGGTAPVEPVNGGGKFTIRGLLPGEVTITAADRSVLATLGPSAPHQDVTIDLTKPLPEFPKRPVVLRFATPDGAVPPQGTIRIYLVKGGENCVTGEKLVSLKDGAAKFDAYAPGQMMYEPKGMIGYWFDTVYNVRVEPGKGPQEITVPVLPAGAIAGQIGDADGKPASEGVYLSVTGELQLPHTLRSGGFGGDNLSADANGRFFVGPLPLGGKYAVKAQRKHVVQIAAPILLDAAHPTTKLTLRFPPTTAVEGEVLDPDGRPLPGLAVGLSFSSPAAPASGSSWSDDLRTDQKGRFRIADLGVGVGQYALEINPNRNFCPTRVELPLDGKPAAVRLKRGHVLTGRLLDDVTGRPIADAQMVAMPTDHFPPSCMAEGLTDREGKFRFSNLDGRSYQIYGRDGLEVSPANGSIWSPGEKSITVRVKILQWSKLRPQPKE
jgi:beta-lactamase regulating signal transducer with metallopeptidase domain